MAQSNSKVGAGHDVARQVGSRVMRKTRKNTGSAVPGADPVAGEGGRERELWDVFAARSRGREREVDERTYQMGPFSGFQWRTCSRPRYGLGFGRRVYNKQRRGRSRGK